MDRTLYTKPTVLRFLDVLSGLGVAVVPKEATDRILRSDRYGGPIASAYRDMVRDENILNRRP
jgi:hypothetical protein